MNQHQLSSRQRRDRHNSTQKPRVQNDFSVFLQENKKQPLTMFDGTVMIGGDMQWPASDLPQLLQVSTPKTSRQADMLTSSHKKKITTQQIQTT